MMSFQDNFSVSEEDNAPIEVELGPDEGAVVESENEPVPQFDENLYRQEFQRLSQERDEAISRANEFEHRNKSLEHSSFISNELALANYEQSSKLRLERARKMKAEAIESGDLDAQVEADVELSAAVSDLQKTNEMVHRFKGEKELMQRRLEQEARQKGASTSQNVGVSDSDRWVQNNPWANPQSPYYNQALMDRVGGFLEQLNGELQQKGMSNRIGTPAYFAAIDEFVIGNMVQPSKEKINMKPSRAPSQSNEHTQNNPRASSKVVTLSAEERSWARRLGVSEKDYAYHKLQDIKQQAERERMR